MLFVPLYLVTGAWDAGFGIQGWHTLSTNPHLAHEPWLAGWRAAVWVHGLAAVPWVVLIVGAGLRAVEAEIEEDAATCAAPQKVMWHVSLRRAAPAIVLAGVWVAIMTTTEISVTDFFQVRTFAEEVYTQAALGTFDASGEQEARSTEQDKSVDPVTLSAPAGTLGSPPSPPSVYGAVSCFPQSWHSQRSSPPAGCSPTCPMRRIDRPGFGDLRIGAGPPQSCCGSACCSLPAFRSATCSTKRAYEVTVTDTARTAHLVAVKSRRATRRGTARIPRRTVVVGTNRSRRRDRRTRDRSAARLEHAHFVKHNADTASSLVPPSRPFALFDNSRPAARHRNNTLAQPPARFAIGSPRLVIRLKLRTMARANAPRPSVGNAHHVASSGQRPAGDARHGRDRRHRLVGPPAPHRAAPTLAGRSRRLARWFGHCRRRTGGHDPRHAAPARSYRLFRFKYFNCFTTASTIASPRFA